jgi:colanic acid biosynthesis glycosyl transferase WcaI
VIGLARALERFCYRRADAVTVLSEDLNANVEAKLATASKPRTRVVTIPNFVDCVAIAPQRRDNRYRDEHGLTGKLVVMYAGNLGHSQPFELVLAAAEAFADRPEVAFVINGDGVARADLDAAAGRHRNLTVIDYQPVERLAEVLGAADLHLVLLKPGLAASSVPSKSYSILAAGRPILAAVDPGTEIAQMIDAADAGTSVGPTSSEAFITALEALLADTEGMAEQGRSGREWVTRWASPEAVARSYADLAAELQ